MIAYNPKDWFSFIFRFHKADTLRQLFPTMLGIMVYAGLLVYFERNFWAVTKESAVSYIGVLHSILGFVISMLLVFRTNTGYERWWEGRKLWGQLTNTIRNASIKISAHTQNGKGEKHVYSMLQDFPFVLKAHLQQKQIRFDEVDSVNLQNLQEAIHKPLVLSELIMREVSEISKRHNLSSSAELSLYQEIQQLMEICGACERIKNTPIPFSYSVFIKKFIFFYIMTLPISMAHTLVYAAMPVVAFIFYVLASLELIAEEIENPFGNDDNDLPLENMCKNISNSVKEISAASH